jgi:hypothetical protein
MQDRVETGAWVEVIQREYLDSFLRDGGSSVKFVVASEETAGPLRTELAARAGELEYLVLRLDALTERAHMPQDLFFALARQIDWRLLARRCILRLASEVYETEGIDPAGSGVFEAVAAANGVTPRFVLKELRPSIEQVSLDSTMAKDFREAVSHLCLKEFGGHEYTGQALLDWLTGANTRVSAVKPFGIAGRIVRTNARYFIESCLHWIREAAFAGTVILFDNRRVTLSRRPKDGHRYYTRAMAVEHYEMLREFIDGLDRLPGTLLAITTGGEFLDTSPDRGSRGYGIYPALQTRVMNDVRDSQRANPVSSLVVLGPETGT